MRRLKQSAIAPFTICGLLAAVAGIVYAASSAIVVKDIAGKSLTFLFGNECELKDGRFHFCAPGLPHLQFLRS
jgi:hypothetical protein